MTASTIQDRSSAIAKPMLAIQCKGGVRKSARGTNDTYASLPPYQGAMRSGSVAAVVPRPAAGGAPRRSARRQTEKVSAADASYLFLPGFFIHLILELRGPVTNKSFDAIANRLGAIERMHQKVTYDSGGTPCWQEVPRFDARVHTGRHNLPTPGDLKSLNDAVADLATSPFDDKRPLWDMTLIDGDSTKSHLYLRFHHAIADGCGIMQALLQWQDDPSLVRELLPELVTVRRHTTARATKTGAADTATNDVCSIIKSQRPVNQMRVDWIQSEWPLAEMKRIARDLSGGTVNDVAMLVIAGALRRYFIEREEPLPSLDLHAVQGVMLPRSQDLGHIQLGNASTHGIAALPLNEPDLRRRFEKVKQENHRIKASATGETISKELHPPEVIRDAVAGLANQVSIYVSNIRGLPRAVTLGGHLLQHIRWFGPTVGNVGLQFPLISYAGNLSVGVWADRALIADLRPLRQALENEFASIQEALPVGGVTHT